MARHVAIGTWGSLAIYEPPGSLRDASGYWTGDERRRPSQLHFRTGILDYIAVWPLDRPPPGGGTLTTPDLDGVALTIPVNHHCFACRASVTGLYCDGGAAFFDPWSHDHDWLQNCPACHAAATTARLTGLLPMPGPPPLEPPAIVPKRLDRK